jgi:hypothetical protein
MSFDLRSVATWQRRWLADGVAFVPPGGLREGFVRVRERQPLRPLRELCATREGNCGPVDRFVTITGEHAAIASVMGTRVCHIALVAGAGDCMIVDAESDVASETWSRELVHAIASAGSHAHARRYIYEPPDHWHAFPHARLVRWVDPRLRGAITVHDAAPSIAITEVHRWLFIDDDPFAVIDSPGEPCACETPRLSGFVRRTTGRATEGAQRTRVKAALDSNDDIYLVVLDCSSQHWEEMAITFDHVLRSIEPVPDACFPRTFDHAAHWAE